MLSSMPVAPSIDSSSSGEVIAALAASAARLSPVAEPMPISAEPASRMIVRTSAKSRLIRPGTVIRSVIPWTPWRRMSSALRKASRTRLAPLDDLQQLLVRDDDQGVDLVAQLLDPVERLLHPAPALELERLRHDADGQRADLLLGDLGDHRRGAGAGAAALAGGDEDHVGALQRLLDVVAALGRGAGADLGVAAGAEAAGQLLADPELDVGVAVASSACASVLTATNSTPLSPASTMRLTALVPPPPTPTTLITARYEDFHLHLSGRPD